MTADTTALRLLLYLGNLLLGRLCCSFCLLLLLLLKCLIYQPLQLLLLS